MLDPACNLLSWEKRSSKAVKFFGIFVTHTFSKLFGRRPSNGMGCATASWSINEIKLKRCNSCYYFYKCRIHFSCTYFILHGFICWKSFKCIWKATGRLRIFSLQISMLNKSLFLWQHICCPWHLAISKSNEHCSKITALNFVLNSIIYDR